jgi:hypothetical protein
MYDKLVDHATSDTTYEGLKMVIRSEVVLDSLARLDSIAVADTIAKADSILKEKPETAPQVEGGRLNLPDNARDRKVVRPQFKKKPAGQLEMNSDKEE